MPVHTNASLKLRRFVNVMQPMTAIITPTMATRLLRLCWRRQTSCWALPCSFSCSRIVEIHALRRLVGVLLPACRQVAPLWRRRVDNCALNDWSAVRRERSDDHRRLLGHVEATIRLFSSEKSVGACPHADHQDVKKHIQYSKK